MKLFPNRHPTRIARGRYDGTLWPYFRLPLAPDAWIEQQMLLPAAGDAALVSWRLFGRASGTVKLSASPIFAAKEAFALAGFEMKPAMSGGQVTWRRVSAFLEGHRRYQPHSPGPVPRGAARRGAGHPRTLPALSSVLRRPLAARGSIR